MNLSRGVISIVAIFALATSANAQAAKDTQAVAILNSCLAASGGAQALGLIQDFTEAGTVIFNWDTPTSAATTLKERVASNQFRFDASLMSNARSWSVGNGLGVLVDIDQSRTTFSSQTAISLRSLSFPVTDFVTALSDPTAAISLVGLTPGGQSYQVRIREIYAASIDPSGALSKATTRDYFIDVKTSLITSIANTQSFGSPAQFLAEAVSYSNYTNVNGLMVPFSVAESVGGQQTWTVQLNSVSFNTGLTDTDFQL